MGFKIIDGLLERYESEPGVTEVTIPNDATRIGYCAFRNCSSITTVIIPDSVTEIGSFAFQDCTSMISVEIPNSVTRIERGAFQGSQQP